MCGCGQAAEGEAKLRAQEKACETMRGERNQAAKALLDAQQELDGLRRKHTLLVRACPCRSLGTAMHVQEAS